MAELLQVRNLTHIYQSDTRKRVVAVDDISFDIKQSQTFGLVGESGCGKTTTGRMIARLLDVTSGQISYDGQNIQTLNKKELLAFRKKVQIIFQDPYASLDPRMKVRDIIAEGIRIHHLAKDKRQEESQVQELLALVGLQPQHATRYPHEFSGGQRQRIGIARALAVQPQFVVCDEPISALDVSIQAQIVNLLKELQKRRNLTYLFIAHDLSMVHYISDRIAVMYAGKLVEMGDSDAVFRNPKHPYTQNLLASLPSLTRQKDAVIYPPYQSNRTLSGDFSLQLVEKDHYVYQNAAGQLW